MSIVVVERAFPNGVDMDEMQALEDKAQWCLDAHSVKFLVSYFSTDRKRMICVYDAPDAEAVRIVNRESGVPFETIWAATVFEPQAQVG